MSKAIQEIVADLRKADMSGAQVDAGHIADQIALAFVELEDKWRREKAEIEANALAVGGIVARERFTPCYYLHGVNFRLPRAVSACGPANSQEAARGSRPQYQQLDLFGAVA